MENQRPIISVIIPCYNYYQFVGRAIDSVLAQANSNIEVLVLDDGSTDQSWEVIASYGQSIRAIRSENMGFIKTCQLGISKTRGDFILILDADDELAPDALVQIWPFLVERTSKVQYQLQPISESGRKIGAPFPVLRSANSSQDLIREITKRGCYQTPSTSGNVYNRRVFDRILNIDYDFGIDGVSYLLAPFLGDVISIEKPLAYYRLHGKNMSGSGSGRADIERLEREAQVFVKRLDHLIRILASEVSLPPQTHFDLNNYNYHVEREVFVRSLKSESVDLSLYAQLAHSAFREFRSFKLFGYLLFCLALALSPRPFKRRLIEVRLNPTAISFFRGKLRR